jgi:hypothetical protein
MDVERELDHIAGELYALLPDAFAAARDDEVRKARSAGRQPLARELSRLRRPTQSAWLVNQLWREESDTVEELLRLAGDLGRAQAGASVPELHRLSARRRELESALIRSAHALAERAGVTVSATMEREVQGTLAAALALPEVADELRTGRLVKPAFYSGFGLPDAMPFAEAEQPQAKDAEDTTVASAPRRKSADLEQRTTERESRRADDTKRPVHEARAAQEAVQRESRRRQDAERRVEEARAALEAAAAALADRTRAAEEAHQHHEEARKRIAEIRAQLRDLEKEAATAENAARVQARRRNDAEKGHEAARRTLERAERYL